MASPGAVRFNGVVSSTSSSLSLSFAPGKPKSYRVRLLPRQSGGVKVGGEIQAIMASVAALRARADSSGGWRSARVSHSIFRFGRESRSDAQGKPLQGGLADVR